MEVPQGEWYGMQDSVWDGEWVGEEEERRGGLWRGHTGDSKGIELLMISSSSLFVSDHRTMGGDIIKLGVAIGVEIFRVTWVYKYNGP